MPHAVRGHRRRSCLRHLERVDATERLVKSRRPGTSLLGTDRVAACIETPCNVERHASGVVVPTKYSQVGLDGAQCPRSFV